MGPDGVLQIILVILIIGIVGAVVWLYIAWNSLYSCSNSESVLCPSYYCPIKSGLCLDPYNPNCKPSKVTCNTPPYDDPNDATCICQTNAPFRYSDPENPSSLQCQVYTITPTLTSNPRNPNDWIASS